MMTITLPADLEKAVMELASQQGISPEKLVFDILQEEFRPRSVEFTRALEPRDAWEAGVRALATPCGTSVSDEALSSENLYE
jgi:hypothetical protein